MPPKLDNCRGQLFFLNNEKSGALSLRCASLLYVNWLWFQQEMTESDYTMRWLAYNRKKPDTVVQESSFSMTLHVVSQKYQTLYQVTTFLNPSFVSYSGGNHCKI